MLRTNSPQNHFPEPKNERSPPSQPSIGLLNRGYNISRFTMVRFRSHSFAARLRADPLLRETPVIFLTAIPKN